MLPAEVPSEVGASVPNSTDTVNESQRGWVTARENKGLGVEPSPQSFCYSILPQIKKKKKIDPTTAKGRSLSNCPQHNSHFLNRILRCLLWLLVADLSSPLATTITPVFQRPPKRLTVSLPLSFFSISSAWVTWKALKPLTRLNHIDHSDRESSVLTVPLSSKAAEGELYALCHAKHRNRDTKERIHSPRGAFKCLGGLAGKHNLQQDNIFSGQLLTIIQIH